MKLAYALVAIGWIGATGSAAAQCAQWDTRFGLPAPGVSSGVSSAVVFDDGSGPALYLGGSFDAAGETAAPRVVRWDGTGWSALGAPGRTLQGFVQALAVFDDGTGPALYAAGWLTFSGLLSNTHVVKWDGASWSSVGLPSSGALGGPGSGPNDVVNDLAVYDDGHGPRLYAGGDFTGVNGMPSPPVARWDGVSWSPVGQGIGGGSGVYALETFDDGSGPALYAGGEFTSLAGVSAQNIARWNGTSWSALGVPGSGVDNRVYALRSFDDGSGPALYAGGRFVTAGGVAASRIARWNGTAWSAVGAPGSGASDDVYTLEVLDVGGGPALYAGGRFWIVGGVAASRLARWDGSSWTAVGPPSPGIDGSVLALAACDDGGGLALFVGGGFRHVGGIPAGYVARWSGSSWTTLGPAGLGLDLKVYTLATFDDGGGPALYAGGSFTSAGGVTIPRIARWSGGSWSALGPPGSGTNGPVQALEVYDDGSGPALYVAGEFTAAGGVPALCIARWDGTSWSAIGAPGSGMNGYVHALEVYDDGSGPALYAAGSFTTAGGVPAASIARWDGTSWSALGAPVDGVSGGIVEALAVFADGNGPALYAAGSFTTAGGAPVQRIARWDGTSWSSLGHGLNGSVIALEVYDFGTGPELYAGGYFFNASGVPAARIARWNGTNWSSLGGTGSGIGFSSNVRALRVFDDGSGPKLFVGGTFAPAGAPAVANVARWSGTWSGFSPLGDNYSEVVEDFCAFDDGADGAPDLFACGSFTTAGTIASAEIAQWRVCPPPAPFCFGDGTADPCPCGNSGLAAHGCENSAATGGAVLTHTGTTVPDMLVLTQAGEISTALSIFLQGKASLDPAVAFGDGLRCVGGDLEQLYVRNATGGSVAAPQPGEPSITARSAELGDPIAPGSTRWYQVYYRDPDRGFCPAAQGSTFNVGNGLRVVW